MIPNEVFDNLDEAGLYTYAWLIRNSVVEDGRRVVKTSVRDMACVWNCSHMTVSRALSKIKDFVTVKRGKNLHQIRQNVLHQKRLQNPLIQRIFNRLLCSRVLHQMLHQI